MGGDKIVQVERAGALNFKSSGMFEGQVLRNKRMQGFIHVSVSGRMPSFNMKAGSLLYTRPLEKTFVSLSEGVLLKMYVDIRLHLFYCFSWGGGITPLLVVPQ